MSSPHLLPPLLAALAAFTFFLLFAFVYKKLTRKRTVPSELKQLHVQRFSFSLLHRATCSFSSTNMVGQGGFGTVYKGVLDSGQEIAVKLMSEVSNQGEAEFQNELALGSAMCCPHVVPVIGFSTLDVDKGCMLRCFGRKRKRKLALVYEMMRNGSLQEALLDRKCVELMMWEKRFDVILAVAKGLDYLHNCCDPGIVHGDVKPSNVLLDGNFEAKIADFGLAHVLIREEDVVMEEEKGHDCRLMIMEEKESVELEDVVVVNVEEKESVELDDVVVVNVEEEEEKEESFRVRIIDGEGDEGSTYVQLEKESVVSEGVIDVVSVDSGNRKGVMGRDWWWKQEHVSGMSDSGRVKDYVMEWIGSEIGKERVKKDWGLVKSCCLVGKGVKCAKVEKEEKQGKKLEWWSSLDRKAYREEKKNREPREWWKEEFCEELTKKKKKERDLGNDGEMWWQRDEDDVPERKRRKSRGSRTSIDGFSGEFRTGRRHSQDWTNGGNIPKSGGISSTPSMRGTVCYIAPECGGGGQVSDKCDVYSFGVLLLVIVSGRRPLQVMASPMAEFERANLISWARQLALNGKLLDLVDSNILCLDREKALLCITIGLLCLQRSPTKRPAMKDIVEMLSGKSEPPNLPFEFSPSPSSNFPFKSRKKAR